MLDLDLSSLLGARPDPAADDAASDGVEILTVCTGNICRSPLAEQLLRLRLPEAIVRSAGTHARDGMAMTPEAAQLAVARAVPEADAAAHRSRWLTERLLQRPDLVLVMTREHRRHVAELAPARVRTTFAAREFARLSGGVTDAELRRSADAAGDTARSRVRAALELIGTRRGAGDAPADPGEDDVIDPIGRSAEVYELSARQLAPAIDEVARVLHAVLH